MIGFLYPAVLGFLALAAAPVIIHLLNRRRFELIEWAPMRHLRLTLRRNRRRMRVEQWLLLALRILAVAALILALARPTVSAQSGVANWFGGRGRTARVLVLDDSLSMGLSGAGRPVFDEARDAVRKIVQAIGPQDSLTLLTTSRPDRPVARLTGMTDKRPALEALEPLQVTDTAGNWAATLEAVRKQLIQSPFPVREVTVLTDLRRVGWSQAVRAAAEALAKEGPAFRIVDLGRDPAANLCLVRLEAEDPVALTGADRPNRLSVLVRNDSAAASAPGQASLVVDDQSRPVQLPAIPAHGSIALPLLIAFVEPGPHAIRLNLPDDALAGDNTACLVVDARQELTAVLVDGEPAATPFDGETDYLQLALTAGSAAWRVEHVTDAQWLSTPLSAAGPPPDLLVLANVGAIPAGRVEEVRELVSRGMGLMIFPGDQVDAGAWNRDVYRLGKGLLPGPIERIDDEPVSGFLPEVVDGSPITRLARLPAARLAGIGRTGACGLSLPEDLAGRRVLARWNDEARGPALVEMTIGKGRVLTWTVAADRAWSDWPVDPTYVLAMREAGAELARGSSVRQASAAGRAIGVELPPEQTVQRPALLLPGASSPTPVDIDRTDAARPRLNFDDALRAGIYRFQWLDAQGKARAALQAVNPDISESDLAAAPRDLLGQWLAPLHPRIVRAEALDQALGGPRQEMWRTVAWLMLGLMACESALAVWAGRQR